jgi:transcription elongation factor Elf1
VITLTETIRHEVGAKIKVRCAKCNALTEHTVLSLKKDEKAKTVRCDSCAYEHAYRQPRTIKSTAGKSAVVKLTAAEKKQAKANAEFDAMMEEVAAEASTPYDLTASFKLNDIMDHPVFGLGKVEELITPDKAVIHFREGRKTLVCVISTEFEA